MDWSHSVEVDGTGLEIRYDLEVAVETPREFFCVLFRPGHGFINGDRLLGERVDDVDDWLGIRKR